MPPLRLGLAQINTTVGDLTGNTERILKSIDQAKKLGVDLLTFPELAVCGYPPEDLLLMPSFVEDNLGCLEQIAPRAEGITVVVGFVDRSEGDIYNAAAVLHDGKVASVHHKVYLPNYGVFDENRYFQAGDSPLVFALQGHRVGINIREDIWYPAGPTEV